MVCLAWHLRILDSRPRMRCLPDRTLHNNLMDLIRCVIFSVLCSWQKAGWMVHILWGPSVHLGVGLQCANISTKVVSSSMWYSWMGYRGLLWVLCSLQKVCQFHFSALVHQAIRVSVVVFKPITHHFLWRCSFGYIYFCQKQFDSKTHLRFSWYIAQKDQWSLLI